MDSNNLQNKFSDELGEKLEEGVRVVKKQVTAKPAPPSPDDKKDLVTGKPVPSKPVLTKLNQQVAQLAQMRIKKVREELARQRLKTSQMNQTNQTNQTVEPAPVQKPADDAVAKMLKSSKSTGEFKGAVGG
ncbi:MAG: hypothetical protein M1484_03725 [Patescibacteria group bacterium]|nr:hypothetical protein [Patescibacteria group bacterium]MCL5432170.1 hypothetical protein [Patescibacteria group bacterium]